MNINQVLAIVLILLTPVVTIGILLLIGLAYRYFGLYYIRIKNSQDPNEQPGVTIPPEVMTLINRFDPRIKIRVSNDRLMLAHAAAFDKSPPYIILSKQFLEQGTPETELFDTHDLVAIVAHELGHIIPKSHTTWLLGIITSGMLIAIILGLVFQLIVPFIITIFLIYWAGSVSREEERRADSFAVVDAQIPAADYARSLVKLYTYYSKQRETATKHWKFMVSSVFALLFKSHPDIEQRVNRIRILYDGESSHRGVG